MNAYQEGPIGSITAGEALTKERFVDFEGKHTVDLKCIGVTLFDADSAAQASILMNGIANVEAGGTITAGNHVSSDADGKAVALTIDNVNDIPKNNGVAMDSAVDGGFLRVKLL